MKQMMQLLNGKICLLAFVGILLLVSNSKSHAANPLNISNSWTLPQDGFTVFYRFFRDKISWYEADAVCQFHHANLVTVDNGVKYDASRAFLSDLNITESVWIGLMRSQNSDRFMWSNSKILDREFGYWAEQIPAIDSPLCAVTDPVRDYRWHSFRCGGPEVASFLCEMEIPDWASECLIRALPSLTIQYLSDSATVQLSRDCGIEGIKRLTCSGKQDQDFIQRELICDFERGNNDPNDMKISAYNEIAHSPENIPSNNMESNKIESLVNQIEASVESSDDKYITSDLMMGDQPYDLKEESKNGDSKPSKNGKKIAGEPNKKLLSKQIMKIKSVETVEDVMMGDAPIDEPLPHSKKSNIEDLKKPADIKLSTSKSLVEQTAPPENRSRRETDEPIKTQIDNMTVSTEPSPKTSSNGIISKILHNSTNSGDHFVPPMLLVHHDNSTEKQKITENTNEKTVVESNDTFTIAPIQSGHRASSPLIDVLSTSTTAIDMNNSVDTSTSDGDNSTNDSIETSEISTTTHFPSVTSAVTTGIQQMPNEHHKTSIMMRPHAPKFGGEILFHAPVFATLKTSSDLLMTMATSLNSLNSSESEIPTEITSLSKSTTATLPSDAPTTASSSITLAEIADMTSQHPHLEIAKRSNGVTVPSKHQQKHDEEESKQHADFTNSNVDFSRYKPNRRRILTKPETHTYIQKIFG